MSTFFERVPLTVTSLSPVHIGCGEEFDPTNYIISEGILYHFDPMRADMSAQEMTRLHSIVNLPGMQPIPAIQKFFLERQETFKSAAHSVVAVSSGVEDQYVRRVGQVAQREQLGRIVLNELAIERTSYHPHTNQPYIPGSSLKGAIRTAWLDEINQGNLGQGGENANNLEKRLLNSRDGFHKDPFRLVKVSDFVGTDVQSKVAFSTNHKKKEVFDKQGNLVLGKGPATRREAILGGQFQSLQGEISFSTLAGVDSARFKSEINNPIPGFQRLAQSCNRYYLPRFKSLIDLLEGRQFVHPNWAKSIQQLLLILQRDFDAGRVMLLRVGRHSGAENVTLDGVRSVRIMQGKGRPPRHSEEGALTVWLASDHENSRSEMLPFGWVLVHANNQAGTEILSAWCDQQPGLNASVVRQKLIDEKSRLKKLREFQRNQAEIRQAQDAKALQQALEQEAILAAMSPQAREIQEFVTRCQNKLQLNSKDPFNPGSGLFSDALKLCREATQEGQQWSTEDKLSLVNVLTEWLPKVVQKLDQPSEWKEARKRLKLTTLVT